MQKEQFLSAGAQPEILQGRRGFVELGHFHKHFIKNKEQKVRQGNILQFFPGCCSDYTWVLNVLDHYLPRVQQAFEDASGSNMRQGSEYSTVVYARVTQSYEYV